MKKLYKKHPTVAPLVYQPVRDPSGSQGHEDKMEFPASEEKALYFSLVLDLNDTLLL